MSERKIIQTISDELAQRIDNHQLEVPMLPEDAGKVVRLTQEPESDASGLANLIQSDQTLAGHVMRVANSAAYSPNSTMASLQQAITRLGMKLISEIALAASVTSSLFNTPGYEKHITYIIRYSLASGLWAKEVARTCRKNVEAAFLAGLLHDIGRPVAVQSALEVADKLGQRLSRQELLALEQLFQRQIGSKVVEIWEMPQSVCNVVRYFDDYKAPHSAQNQTMTVVAGSLIAGHFMCEENEEEECMPIETLMEQEVLGDLNLYQDEIETLLEKNEQVNDALEAMTS